MFVTTRSSIDVAEAVTRAPQVVWEKKLKGQTLCRVLAVPSRALTSTVRPSGIVDMERLRAGVRAVRHNGGGGDLDAFL